MDKYYPKNIDPRPHRRHNKDNPYTIFTVGINTDTPHYYVSFKEGQGVLICFEIEKSIHYRFIGNLLNPTQKAG